MGDVAERVAAGLLACDQTVAVAESCTGGGVGACLTARGGSSAYFLGGVIAYANRIKAALLGVQESILERHGAVSAPVAEEMAIGVRARCGADYGIAVTGIAGPDGGTEEKPVGLVFVAVASGQGCHVLELRLTGDRPAIRKQSVDAALGLLLETLHSA
jgi:PncC family amidohydrolase